MKRGIYNDQKWFFDNPFWDREFDGIPPIENLHNLVFTRDFVRNVFLDEGKPVFKYIHFFGPHLSLRLNERLEYTSMPKSRKNFVTYSRAGVTILRKIFTRLKEVGAFDKAGPGTAKVFGPVRTG